MLLLNYLQKRKMRSSVPTGKTWSWQLHQVQKHKEWDFCQETL